MKGNIKPNSVKTFQVTFKPVFSMGLFNSTLKLFLRENGVQDQLSSLAQNEGDLIFFSLILSFFKSE